MYKPEYNSHFPIDAAVTFPNDITEFWENDRLYGASLRALNIVGEKHSYSLIHVIKPLDAFFIRDDLIDLNKKPSLKSFETFCNVIHHAPFASL